MPLVLSMMVLIWCPPLTFSVIFGPLVSIFSASVPSPPFYIFFLVWNVLTIFNSRVLCTYHKREINVCRMIMWSYPHLLGLYSLINTSFLEFAGCVNPAETYIPINLHLPWNHMHVFSCSVARWCFRVSRTILKYSRICFHVRPYSNTSSTMIFDYTFSACAP